MTRRLLFFLAFLLLAASAGWRFIVESIHGRTLKHLALVPGMMVLDIGCGQGSLSVRIAREVGPTGRVVGVEIDSKVVRAAERRAKRAGLDNVRFRRLAFGDGPFDDGSFDRAILVAVLGEIRNRHAAMIAIFRALKPGGMLAVTEVVFDPHRRPPEDVGQLAALAGLEKHEHFTDTLAYTMTFRKPL